MGGHTRGLATDISWKLLDDVSAHQRTAKAIVGLFGRQRSERQRTVACFSVFSVLACGAQCAQQRQYILPHGVTSEKMSDSL